LVFNTITGHIRRSSFYITPYEAIPEILTGETNIDAWENWSATETIVTIQFSMSYEAVWDHSGEHAACTACWSASSDNCLQRGLNEHRWYNLIMIRNLCLGRPPRQI